MRNRLMLKEKEDKLLSYLRKNSRDTITRISKKTGVPISTIFDRIKSYKKLCIERFTCLLNFSELGLKSHSFVVFGVNKTKREEMKKFFVTSENVNAVIRINHKYDFLVELVFSDIQQLEFFLDRVDERFGTRPKHIFYVVEDVGRELFLTGETLGSDPNQKP